MARTAANGSSPCARARAATQNCWKSEAEGGGRREASQASVPASAATARRAIDRERLSPTVRPPGLVLALAAFAGCWTGRTGLGAERLAGPRLAGGGADRGIEP